MPRQINKFFSPRVQGQYTPQFIEEPFPFQEAFMVGAGQQKRIEDQLLQQQALEDVQTRPIAEDIEQRDQIISGLQTEVQDILSRKGGDPSVAARDISKAISRVKRDPFFSRNAAALAQYESAREIQDKISGRGEIPLGLDITALQTPLKDPKTGEFNRIGYNIVETPDFAARVDDQFQDLKAKKTQGGLRGTGVEGVMQSDTKIELTEQDIRDQAEAGVDDFLAANPLWGPHMLQQGVKISGMRAATADFIEGRLRQKLQKDKTVTFVRVPTEDKKDVNLYDGWGIGDNINARVARNHNTQRGVTIPGETVADEYGIPVETGDGQQLNLSSENEWTIKQDNAAGSHYKLLISPQVMWDLEDFGTPITNVGEEDFELEKVQDFLVADKDLEINGVPYKAGQIIPDEDVLGADLATLQSLPDPPAVSRKFHAIGRIKTEEQVPGALAGDTEMVERSVAIPYSSVKKSIKAATGGDGQGGFEVNEADFFKGPEAKPEFTNVQQGVLDGQQITIGYNNGKWFNVDTGEEIK